MSYIAFDLDALNAAPAVARAAGVSENDVLGGLLRLWAWCFRTETDIVSSLQLRGHFGVDAGPALEAFGFLAKLDDGWRVRGAERYLKVKASQRSAAARTNTRKTETPPSGLATVDRRSTDAPPTVDRTVDRTVYPRSTPSTEHRAPNTEHQGEDPPPRKPEAIPVVFEAPTKPLDVWTGEDFFAWAQSRRQQAGLVGERRRPRNLSAWWSTCLMTPEVSVARLREAFLRFGDDPHWQSATPPLPFGAFVAQWDQFLPREVAHAS